MAESRVGLVVQEWLRMHGKTRLATEIGASSSVAVRTLPDGRRFYPDLGLMAEPGETLEELLARKRREAVAEMFSQAELPAAFTEWTFASFPQTKAKQEAWEAAKVYAEDSGSRGNLLLSGPSGVGKTGLAVCILRARIEQGVPALFVQVPDLLDKIRATFSEKSEVDYTQVVEAVKTVDFLVLDDLGAHHATEWAREKLFQIIGYRHDWRLPMVITTDRPLAELEQAIGRRTLARIVEFGQVVEMAGRDLRRLR